MSTFDIPHYSPMFLWKFWLSPRTSDATKQSRVHVYGVYANDFSELLSAPGAEAHTVFHAFRHGPLSDCTLRTLRQAEELFYALESEAEQVLTTLVHLVGSCTHDSDEAWRSSKLKSIPLGRAANAVLLKYFVFLRFRNGSGYGRIVKGLAERVFQVDPRVSCSALHHDQGDSYGILFRQLRCQAFLQSFIEFFKADFDDRDCNLNPQTRSPLPRDSLHGIMNQYCWEFCHSAEASLGIATDGQEYILPDCYFGILDEEFGAGGGSRTSDCHDAFFPISPTLALYVLSGLRRSGPRKHTLEVGWESAIDIHLRNAMTLSTVPHNHNICHTDAVSSTDMVFSPSSPCSSYGSIYDDDLQPPFNDHKIYFSSLTSITQSLSSYDEFRCRWIPDQFIDYSRLKQRCRQLFQMETVTKMLTLKGTVIVTDLTDEVELMGDGPAAGGSFGDVWKGKWWDPVEKRDRVVAVKFLRYAILGNDKEKLLKRLQAEVVTWHQLCHRNIAQLFGIVQKPRIGMVSGWCDNGSVCNYLVKNPLADRMKLLIHIASGVSYLHNLRPSIVHGDLKGENILIDYNGQPIITDFGLSKVLVDICDSNHANVVSSSFAGSTRWMAPELMLALRDEDEAIPEVTTYSDVYAYASVCFEIVSGQIPYPLRKNNAAVMFDIIKGVKPTMGTTISCHRLRIRRQYRGGSGEDAFRSVLDRCWGKSPYLRPTMGEVLKFLIGLEACS